MKDFNAGQFVKQGYFKSFQPDPINRQWQLDNMEVIGLLSQADRVLGRLDMFSDYIPNIDLFISMHILKEATQSSRIEGTKTNMEEALLDLEDVPPGKEGDWEEVQNYIHALASAIKDLEKLPLSSRLICETHKILMQGVRGEQKQPGTFRKSQNWIGGATLQDATFIPPVHTLIPELMSDLEKFIHNTDAFLPDLLKIALIHYQFETIHPFLDGNGRTGRLLITLYLVSKNILKKPVLYLSDFLERNRLHYYDHLMRVRTNNDLTGWMKFFLVGVIETARSSITTFDGILKLQKRTEGKIKNLGSRAVNALKVADYLYKHPLINAEKVQNVTGISSPSAYSLVADLEKLQIIKEVTGGKRGRLYVFTEYLNLFKK
jgi:Fic family protein